MVCHSDFDLLFAFICFVRIILGRDPIPAHATFCMKIGMFREFSISKSQELLKPTKANLKMMCVMVMVCIRSPMVPPTVDNGKQTECTAKESTQQREEESMRASGTMARK
jgi:hypothetical protein